MFSTLMHESFNFGFPPEPSKLGSRITLKSPPIITLQSMSIDFVWGVNISGTPLRPKAARVEPHTHTKRHDGFLLWSWQAEWLAGACAVRPSHFMTFLHEAIFAQLLANGVRGIA